MTSNPFLQGACAQNRCKVCSRILANGVCLEGCQAGDAPPATMSPSAPSDGDESELLQPRTGLIDPPVFSDWQRVPLPKPTETWTNKRRAPEDEDATGNMRSKAARMFSTTAAPPKRGPGRPRRDGACPPPKEKAVRKRPASLRPKFAKSPQSPLTFGRSRMSHHGGRLGFCACQGET